MIKLEKGMPVPEKSPNASREEVFNAIKEMEIGDSFFIPSEGTEEEIEYRRVKVLNQIRYFRLRPGNPNINVTSRRVEGGFRFWRIE